MKNKSSKLPTSMRLTPEAKTLIKALAKHMGISQAAVLEVAIRQMAKKENVKNG